MTGAEVTLAVERNAQPVVHFVEDNLHGHVLTRAWVARHERALEVGNERLHEACDVMLRYADVALDLIGAVEALDWTS